MRRPAQTASCSSVHLTRTGAVGVQSASKECFAAAAAALQWAKVDECLTLDTLGGLAEKGMAERQGRAPADYYAPPSMTRRWIELLERMPGDSQQKSAHAVAVRRAVEELIEREVTSRR